MVATQVGSPPQPAGNASIRHAPHGVWQCAGDDDWISIVVRSDAEWRALCSLVPGLSGLAALDLGRRRNAQRAIDTALTAWAASQSSSKAATALLDAAIPAAALARYRDLVESPHLAARAFWDRHDAGVLPGLPWRASFGRAMGRAPELGADCHQVLAHVLGLSERRIAELRTCGALG
jgi:crotonobetainyl-CoA:carnitine CoA-transferase CaiB-like acyl-CoA transferase